MVEWLFALDSRVQTLVVCGRNVELKQRIDHLVKDRPSQFKVLGYTNDMPRLMHMADLLIGKPGGMTSAEALAAGLPMCIVNPIPGQEERNSDHLLESGVAIKCNELSTLDFKIARLLEDPSKLASMRANAIGSAKPFAARTVAHTLLEENLPPLSLSRQQRLRMVTGGQR